MKIFRCEQIKQIDEYTIRNEPVASIDLMERATGKLLEWYVTKFERSRPILIFTGPGNNGGDGLALARMLAKNGYKPEVCYVQFTDKNSNDWEINRERLEKIPFQTIKKIDQFPAVQSGTIIIDAIFGSGLSRPVDGFASEVIHQINRVGSTVISIDIPSGLFGEDNSSNNPGNIIKANYTLSFQFPKLSFMFPENEKFTGEWTVLPIGLDAGVIDKTITPWQLLEKELVKPLLKKRNKFDHKGSYGHGLFVGGSYGKMGAVILSARAALRTGIGLITCHIPSKGNLIMQTAVPEAMLINDIGERSVSEIGSIESFSAVGIGPGMGKEAVSQKALQSLLRNCKKPIVIDADALNILSENKDWYQYIPAGAILTPHPKEFERLAGRTKNGFDRLRRQTEFSEKQNCIIVLKGAHTSISAPDGRVWFNSTGNPGMATAGSGDVLTGIILSLLAQGYSHVNASVTGVYIHGLAGDIAAGKSSFESVIASDIIDEIGTAFNRIRELE
ncbi:MAG: NAD(P)H-hydrate dehydratase [Bacteroidia bacterium]|nr:NAD(P)H-hydrate dehydratase [Bacteroidia bacterium]